MSVPPAATSVIFSSLEAALLAAFQGRFRLAGRRFVPRTGPTEREEEPFGVAAWRVVAREALALHEAYTKGRGEFAHEANPIHARQGGYQFYYLPRNVFRVRYVLDELPWVGETALARLMPLCGRAGGGAELQVLDLGCGSGAFSLALLDWLAGLRGPGEELPALRLVLVDQGRALLDLAEANVRALLARIPAGGAVTLETRPEGVEAFLAGDSPGKRFGIVGAAMMLNELNLLTPGRGGRRAARFTTPLRRLVKDGGLMLFVEPGTRKGYMHLMAVREQLAGLPILYPCPHNKPCPLWEPRVRRWCHATRPLPQPFGFDADLRRAGRMAFQMRELNLAGLALQASPGGVPQAPFRRVAGARVVSGRLTGRKGGAKNKKEPPAPAVVLRCGPDGRLSEVAAGELGAFPRGLWVPGAVAASEAPRVPARPRGRAAGKKWARKR